MVYSGLHRDQSNQTIPGLLQSFRVRATDSDASGERGIKKLYSMLSKELTQSETKKALNFVTLPISNASEMRQTDVSVKLPFFCSASMKCL